MSSSAESGWAVSRVLDAVNEADVPQELARLRPTEPLAGARILPACPGVATSRRRRQKPRFLPPADSAGSRKNRQETTFSNQQRLPKELFHLRDERGRLHIERTRELAERSQSGLADAALDLAHEGSVDIRTERERFLGNTGGYALFSQHPTESC
jgi:hypothetical protein